MSHALLATLFALLGTCDKLAAGEQQATTECARDEDCAVVPGAFTCCPDESCPPAPPFRAAPAWIVDGLYIENENRCLATEEACNEARCPAVPAGCRAEAICDAGRCAAVPIGCELPTS